MARRKGCVVVNQELLRVFREKLRDGVVVGPFMKSSDPAFVEAAGYAGMDFVILDMEHGPVSLQEMQNNVRAAQLANTLPIVRVRRLSEIDIGQALDIGAAGVEIPQITCAEDARNAVRFARFYPQGERGVCRFVRAAHYSMQAQDAYFCNANRSLVIIQLEGQQAVHSLEEILEVPGLDIVFIGPYDLSQSLGLPGQVDHPRVREQMRMIVEHARCKGIAVGTFTDTPAMAEEWMRAGVRYISYSVDVGIFADACRAIAVQLCGEAFRSGGKIDLVDRRL